MQHIFWSGWHWLSPAGYGVKSVWQLFWHIPLLSVQLVSGQFPQSMEQLEQSSVVWQMVSPHPGVQFPQSCEQLEQFSFALQLLSPQ